MAHIDLARIFLLPNLKIPWEDYFNKGSSDTFHGGHETLLSSRLNRKHSKLKATKVEKAFQFLESLEFKCFRN